MLHLSSFFIAQELKKRGYKVSSFSDNDLLLIEKNGRHFYTHASITVQNTTSYLICRDKFLTKQVLLNFNLPTAKGVLLTRETIEDVAQLNYPVVLKPFNLSGGVGVSLDVRSVEEVRTYFQLHPAYTQVLAEHTLVGKDTRVLIVRGKFFAACQREPAFVVGDGMHTIEELIVITNKIRTESQARQTRDNVWDEDVFPILFDVDCKDHIQKQGYELTYVPKIEEKIFVRLNANVASGGVSIDVTNDVCPEIREMCEKVAAKLGMTTAGIDLMSESLSIPLEQQIGAGIVEVNASPGLSLHILTYIGKRRDPVPLIVDEIEERFNSE